MSGEMQGVQGFWGWGAMRLVAAGEAARQEGRRTFDAGAIDGLRLAVALEM
jgi:hypothetical protein